MIQVANQTQELQYSELPFFENSLKTIASKEGLIQLSFQLSAPQSKTEVSEPSGLLEALQAYLAGEMPSVNWPVDWSLLRGTHFQKKVWRALCQIPPGEVASYKEIAKIVDSPQAARAVGTACAQNPILLVIPCHRVVAQGHWGGYSGGGLEIKKRLLRLEGHSL